MINTLPNKEVNDKIRSMCNFNITNKYLERKIIGSLQIIIYYIKVKG